MYFLQNFNKEIVKRLFILLKRDFYHDYVDLFVRQRMAEYEASENLRQDAIIIEDLICKKNVTQSMIALEKWLEEVNFHLMPKKIEIEQDSNKKNNFISNLRTSEEYELSDILYFIHAPIPLLLISMLWSTTVGLLLEEQIGQNCMGNRLDVRENEEDFSDTTFTIFKYYLPEYNRWRDQAINISLTNLETGNNILLIALDIKHCYYNLPVSWEKIEEIIIQAKIDDDKVREKCLMLNNLLEKIHRAYHEKAKDFLKVTHYDEKFDEEYIQGIPIGLPSSKIIANFELRILDSKINEKLRPLYYGRYVDDILVVINNPDTKHLKPDEIIEKYFKDTKILESKNGNCQVQEYERLIIQEKKLIFHYYDHKSSWAGLQEFKKDLRTQASEFRFLPEKDLCKEISPDAYDLSYDGSINKLRSIIGVKENSTKLSNILYEKILKYWLGEKKISEKDLDQVSRFYQGANIFDYCRTWERVFTLLVTNEQIRDCKSIYTTFKKTIKKLRYKKCLAEGIYSLIQGKVQKDCETYLLIAFSNALGLVSYADMKNIGERIDGNATPLSEKFRKYHLIRHQFVAWPLLEFTDTEESLIKFDLRELKISFDDYPSYEKILSDSPRFVHMDDWLLFVYLKYLKQDSLDEFFTNEWKKIKKIPSGNKIEYSEPKSDVVKINSVKIIDSNKKNDYLRIGVVNLCVDEKNIKASYHPNKKPNLSITRQSEIFSLLNEAIRNPKCDIVILPEVSIPFAWLPFMVKQARRNDMGMIFGLEHWLVRQDKKENLLAYNLVATVLPYKYNNHYHSCFISLRNKNHYAPSEAKDLLSLNLSIPNNNNKTVYELFNWRNCVFTVFNCFELTDVKHRGLFRSDIDLLISISCNRDVNYYASIIESTARDIHCYTVQANTSQYGDSRITLPKSTEKKDILKISGGENAVLLKGTINIEELRDFQSHTYLSQDERFKSTPAGFDHDKARNRGK